MVWVGTAGWSVPAETKGSGSHLSRYARMLRCAEINSSFYRSHRAATWARWAAETPANFRFAVKAPKSMTHELKLVGTEPILSQFLIEIRPLGEKLGPVLFQLPPSLRFDPEAAKAFLEDVRHLFAGEVALEPRHESWLGVEADRMLRDFGVSRVAADPAKGGPQAAHPGGDPGLAYFRLHGSPRTYYSDYNEAFLGNLAGQLSGRERAWVIFDNTAAGRAFPNSLRLQDLLSGPESAHRKVR